MNLSYRARRNLSRLGITLLILILVVTVVWLCWVIWLERYVVYSDEGAKLNFDISAEDLSGVEAVPPAAGETIGIYYNEGDQLIDPDNSLTQLVGYYVDTATLMGGVAPVRQQIEALAPGTAIMVDMKSIYGNFFYSTKISGAPTADAIDTAAMDQLISYLESSSLYTIARVPALRDRDYGENHVSSGLPIEGGYLWSDDDNCYWLDPAGSGTIAYLIQIANELRELGFDEVVFTDFYFPETDEIVYSSETPKSEILAKTASDLVATCAGNTFAVSFETTDPTLRIPEGRSRLYLEGVDASDVSGTVQQVTVTDTLVNLVFLSYTNDTRFNAYGVLRPLANAK